jgi:hypothetical protein
MKAEAIRDLWGAPILPEKRRGSKIKGYAYPPGTGPAGETCQTCAHLCRLQHAKTYFKCGLIRPNWTHGPGTDIRARSPACKLWTPKPTPPPPTDS